MTARPASTAAASAAAPLPKRATRAVAVRSLLEVTASYVAFSLAGILGQASWSAMLRVWTPAGLGVAAAIALGRSACLAIFVGVLLTGLAIGHLTTVPQFSGGLAVAWSVQPALIVMFLRRYGVADRLAGMRDLALFVVAAAAGAAFSATYFAGYAQLGCAAGRPDVLPALTFGPRPCDLSPGLVFVARALADTVSIVCWAPLLLTLRAAITERPRRWPSRRRQAELAGHVVAVGAVVADIFFRPPGDAPLRALLGPALLFPLLVGVVVRCGRAGGLAAAFVAGSLTLYATNVGRGPFVLLQAHLSILVAEAFMVLLALTALGFALVFEQKRAAVAAREKILAVVSHDLRSPVTAVRLQVERLMRRDTLPDPALLVRALARVRRAAGRMDALIDDLADVAQLERQVLPLEVGRVPVGKLLDECADLGGELARAHGLTLQVAADSAAGLHIEGDARRLGQALGNLVQNALKYTPRGGTVVLGAEPTDTHVRLCVADNGPGMSAEVIARLGEPFWQAQSTGRSGAGLGLTIVHGILAAHRTQLEVRCGPDGGSHFSFRLPRDADALPPEIPQV